MCQSVAMLCWETMSRVSIWGGQGHGLILKGDRQPHCGPSISDIYQSLCPRIWSKGQERPGLLYHEGWRMAFHFCPPSVIQGIQSDEPSERSTGQGEEATVLVWPLWQSQLTSLHLSLSICAKEHLPQWCLISLLPFSSSVPLSGAKRPREKILLSGKSRSY